MEWLPESASPNAITDASKELNAIIKQQLEPMYHWNSVDLQERRIKLSRSIKETDDRDIEVLKLRATVGFFVESVSSENLIKVRFPQKSVYEMLVSLSEQHRVTMGSLLVRSFCVQEADKSKAAMDIWIKTFKHPDLKEKESPIHDDLLIEEAYAERAWSFALHKQLQKFYETVVSGRIPNDL